MPEFLISQSDELRLRELAVELAKGIEEPHDVIARLGFTTADYEELTTTRMFKRMLDQAVAEWGGVANTPKRVRLKAAVNIENGLPDMFAAMVSDKEPLSSRVKVFEIMSRIGGLGAPDPLNVDSGQAFNLTIHLDGGKPPIIIENSARQGPAASLDHSESYGAHSDVSARNIGTQSKVFANIPLEEL